MSLARIKLLDFRIAELNGIKLHLFHLENYTRETKFDLLELSVQFTKHPPVSLQGKKPKN